MSRESDGRPQWPTWPLGFLAFRIPSIVERDGVLIAFAEAYPMGPPFPSSGHLPPHGDCAQILYKLNRTMDLLSGYKPIVFKTSHDGGASWSALELVQDPSVAWPLAEKSTTWDPTALVDPETGTIHLLFGRQHVDVAHPERPCTRPPTDWCGWTKYNPCPYGPVCNDLWVLSSSDLGKTWSSTNVTEQIVGSPGGSDLTWESMVFLSGANGMGIKTSGGRLMFPTYKYVKYLNSSMMHTIASGQGQAVFSDDGGKSWRIGDNVQPLIEPSARGTVGIDSGEGQVAEMYSLTGGDDDGSGGKDIFYELRVDTPMKCTMGTKHCRLTARSSDGGVSWSHLEQPGDLPAQALKSGLVRWPSRRAFIYGGCTTWDSVTNHCEDLEARVSFDNGATWPHRKTIVPGHLAYVVTLMVGEKLHVLYERAGRCGNLTLAVLDPSILLEP